MEHGSVTTVLPERNARRQMAHVWRSVSAVDASSSEVDGDGVGERGKKPWAGGGAAAGSWGTGCKGTAGGAP